MKRIVAVVALLLFFVAYPASVGASSIRSNTDMRGMKRIFVGWVNLHPEAYASLDYTNKQDWTDEIKLVNDYFSAAVLKALPDRTITMAKSVDDENAAGNDLYIKFTDVSEDHGYRMHLAIHYIDAKTNTEIVAIPLETYVGHVCSLEGCLEKELSKVGDRIQKDIDSPPGSKL